MRRRKPFSEAERRAIVGLLCVFVLVAFFWATYDQQGNTLLLWCEDYTERSIDLGFWKGEIPTTWFLALNPLMIFVFTPILIKLWSVERQIGAELSTISKLALGFLCVALGNLMMAAAAWDLAPAAKASPWWLVGYFTIVTLGELHLAPVGLALISRLAPARVLSLMMGLWLAATFPGDVLGGWLGGFWSTMEKSNFFLMIGAIAGTAGQRPFAGDAHEVDAARRVFDLQAAHRGRDVDALGQARAQDLLVERLARGKQQRLDQPQFLRPFHRRLAPRSCRLRPVRRRRHVASPWPCVTPPSLNRCRRRCAARAVLAQEDRPECPVLMHLERALAHHFEHRGEARRHHGRAHRRVDQIA